MLSTNSTALNGICPYFTMFPLNFPYSILSSHAQQGEWIIDPFCGRGTTNYAGRLLGLPSIGIDSNPVAVALSQAKLANTDPASIMEVAHQILENTTEPREVPEGEFWEWAFQPDVLHSLCRLREGLLKDCESDAQRALRAIVMGALHGPQGKTRQTYFSNQSPRTYAPKPRYAVKFWEKHKLKPLPVDILQIIEVRARRYYEVETTLASGNIIFGDSRQISSYKKIGGSQKFSWVITSPPYYGMRTYIPDQWLRLWFLGGSACVDYTNEGQIRHSSPTAFTQQLKEVWQNVGSYCQPEARLVIRFGAINDRKVDPLALIKKSLLDSGWEITAIHSAGLASAGRRQALQITRTKNHAIEEYDIWAIRVG